jgi:hypothetical protein
MRNALRYTISAREYGLLHKYVISRSKAFKKRAMSVEGFREVVEGSGAQAQGKGKGKGKEKDEGRVKVVDDYNARAVRHSLRVFIATGAAMKLWEMVQRRLGKKNE